MKKIFSLLVLVMTIAGCGNKIPACGDPEVIKKVSQLIAEKVNETEDADLKKFIKDRLIIDIANPIVVSENEKLGKRECKAEGKYTAQEDQLKHLLSVNENADVGKDVGFRWQLMTGALTHMEYLLLEEIKAKVEKSGDKKLADLIEGRWNNFKESIGVKDNPVALFATLMNSKIQSDVDKSAKEQHDAFMKYLEQLDKNKGSIKFNVKYKIEKTDEKGNPYLISAEWNESILEGVVYGIVWENAFLDREEFLNSKK